MRRYGDGRFGVVLDDDWRVKYRTGRVIDVRGGPVAEQSPSRYPAFLIRLKVVLPILFIVNLDRIGQVEPCRLQLPQLYPTLYRFG